jgi:hypothetical protein
LGQNLATAAHLTFLSAHAGPTIVRGTDLWALDASNATPYAVFHFLGLWWMGTARRPIRVGLWRDLLSVSGR